MEEVLNIIIYKVVQATVWIPDKSDNFRKILTVCSALNTMVFRVEEVERSIELEKRVRLSRFSVQCENRFDTIIQPTTRQNANALAVLTPLFVTANVLVVVGPLFD